MTAPATETRSRRLADQLAGQLGADDEFSTLGYCATTCELAEASKLAVIASGGVHTLEDVWAARDAKLAGVVIGRALYEETINLSEALSGVANAC